MKVADKLMQDVFIADKTGTARVTLWVWEENVGQVEEGRSYTTLESVKVWANALLQINNVGRVLCVDPSKRAQSSQCCRHRVKKESRKFLHYKGELIKDFSLHDVGPYIV